MPDPSIELENNGANARRKYVPSQVSLKKLGVGWGYGEDLLSFGSSPYPYPTRYRRTIVFIRCSSASVSRSHWPVCTGEVCTMVLRGATSQ